MKRINRNDDKLRGYIILSSVYIYINVRTKEISVFLFVCLTKVTSSLGKSVFLPLFVLTVLCRRFSG